jgi:pimeloyl-ACP methyl ester carboxylesterase
MSIVLTSLLVFAASGRPATSFRGLAYERTGSGPGVVLLHCLGGDRTVWDQEAPRLAKTHTVLNVELPGHGQSPAPARVNFSEIALQITQLIRNQRLAPAVVIGHSIGGTIAAWTPVVDSGAVKAVLIVDSTIAELPWTPKALDDLRKSLTANYVAGLRSLYAPVANGSAQVKRLITTARHVPRETLLGYLEFAVHNSVVKDLQKINLPVEVVASGLFFETSNHKKELAEAGYDGLRDFSLEEMPGTRHWVYWDQPERYASLVDAFLRRVEATGEKRPSTR